MIYNFEVLEADNIDSNLEQNMQGSEVYLPTTSEGNENKSLWRIKSVDNCAPISRDLELHGQG